MFVSEEFVCRVGSVRLVSFFFRGVDCMVSFFYE